MERHEPDDAVPGSALETEDPSQTVMDPCDKERPLPSSSSSPQDPSHGSGSDPESSRTPAPSTRPAVDDDHSCPSTEEDDHDDSDDETGSDDDAAERLPLLHYVRLPVGTGRPDAALAPPHRVTTSCLGRVVVTSETFVAEATSERPGSAPGPSDAVTTTGTTTTTTLPSWRSSPSPTGPSTHTASTRLAADDPGSGAPPPPSPWLWHNTSIPLLWLGYHQQQPLPHGNDTSHRLGLWALTSAHTAGTPVLWSQSREATHKVLTLPPRDEPGETADSNAALVHVGMDASGTLLAAMNRGGTLGVFHVKYRLVWAHENNQDEHRREPLPEQDHHHNSTVAQRKPKSSHLLAGLWSAWQGPAPETPPPPPPSSPLRSSATLESDASRGPGLPALAFSSVTLAHCIRYPPSFGPPTCCVMDPASTHRRELAVVVGFASGRLMLTRKRGMFVQRRQDSVLYQGVPASTEATTDTTLKYFNENEPQGWSDEYTGIEALTWRGSLLAWADATGIRIMDMDSLTRLAHVDRPTGAKPCLYPTIRDLKPHMVFETATTLLCGWGDCLLSLQVKEQGPTLWNAATSASMAGTTEHPTPSTDRSMGAPTPCDDEPQALDESAVAGSGALQQSPPPSPNPVPYGSATGRRRVVECTMAWQLDCVAAGVVPLDQEHVTVLGVVPPPVVDHDGENQGSTRTVTNDVELQIISRSTGGVVYADLLPLAKPDLTVGHGMESVGALDLLSTFCFPKMDDWKEIKEQQQRLQECEELDTTTFSSSPRTHYVDPHSKWKLEMSLLSDDDPDFTSNRAQGDSDSVDSDDYGAILEAIPSDQGSTHGDAFPPLMAVISAADVILLRLNDIDDTVSYALSNDKPALALRQALLHLRKLRRYELNDLVDEYFRALLRLPRIQGRDELVDVPKEPHSSTSTRSYLSLRRMKLAAEAMPVLLGGDPEPWNRWIGKIENIPGALFLARKFVPVRDPVLPKATYSNVLQKMLLQVEQMEPGRLADEAASHFLDTLVGWGPSFVLDQFIKLFKYESETDSSIVAPLRAMEESLKRRHTQSAASYLQQQHQAAFMSPVHPAAGEGEANQECFQEGLDALFDVDDMMAFVLDRVTEDQRRVDYFTSTSGKDNSLRTQVGKDSRVALEALVRLKMMQGSFDDALRYYLLIGSKYSVTDLEKFEDEAIAAVNLVDPGEYRPWRHPASYTHVLSIIESLHLHQCLLDLHFIAQDGIPPLFALLQLVGLDTFGEFLLSACVSPQNDSALSTLNQEMTHVRISERRGTLPIDLVAKQLEPRPKLLHWYLHLTFNRKPEVYARFSTTSSPPAEIIRLQRKHIDLYLRFAGKNKDSSKVFQGIEAYRVPETFTPLLAFLKVALQVGALSATEIAKKIEIERKGGDGNSHTFALELAYIMEQFGTDEEDQALLILDLYLKGVENLMLAVSFAQRSRQHSALLWRTMIKFCLESVEKYPNTKARIGEGSLFGTLLEAAALSGGDLGNLISQIPAGMAIEGLRPRLVAAVTDYRLKVQMGDSATSVALNDRKALIREAEYRSRRGRRFASGLAVEVESTISSATSNVAASNKQASAAESARFRRKRLNPPSESSKFSLFTAIHT